MKNESLGPFHFAGKKPYQVGIYLPYNLQKAMGLGLDILGDGLAGIQGDR